MWNSFTCKSRYIVYFITCSKCGAQYVGMTTNTMMERHGGHRREIQVPLGRHFSRFGITNLSLQIIAGVKKRRRMPYKLQKDPGNQGLALWSHRGALTTWTKERKFKRSTVFIIKNFETKPKVHTFSFSLY